MLPDIPDTPGEREAQDYLSSPESNYFLDTVIPWGESGRSIRVLHALCVVNAVQTGLSDPVRTHWLFVELERWVQLAKLERGWTCEQLYSQRTN